MANYSDFSITITGELFNLRSAYDEYTKLSPWDFSISEIYEDYFTHEPPTWNLNGTGRWSIETQKFIELFSKHKLSGEIVDAELGSNFFIRIELVEGEEKYLCNTDYMSDEHAEWLNDPHYWTEAYDFALKAPEEYPKIIEFLNKFGVHNEQS